MKNKIIGIVLIITILIAMILGIATKHMAEGILVILLIRFFLPILITNNKKEDL